MQKPTSIYPRIVLVLLCALLIRSEAAKAQATDELYPESFTTELSQARFGMALEIASVFLRACLVRNLECRLDDSELKLARAIIRELDSALRPKLIFVSGRDRPDLLHLDGEMRIAATGSVPGSAIYINTDMIRLPKASLFAPFEIDQAMSILAHELGHHHAAGGLSHAALDRFGVKVRDAMVMRKQRLRIPIQVSEALTLTAYQSGDDGSYDFATSYVHLSGPFGWLDVNDGVESVTCPRMFIKGDLDFEGKAFAWFSKSPLRMRLAEGKDPVLLIAADRVGFHCYSTVAQTATTRHFFPGYGNGTIEIPLRRTLDLLEPDAARMLFRFDPPEDIYFY